MFIRIEIEIDVFREAFKQSCTSNHSVYDMMYIIIARRNNATLLSTDNKLLQTAKRLSIDLV
jgi:predicted nucleic acid-binding protein